jgi:hypothetical protein
MSSADGTFVMRQERNRHTSFSFSNVMEQADLKKEA